VDDMIAADSTTIAVPSREWAYLPLAILFLPLILIHRVQSGSVPATLVVLGLIGWFWARHI
jgi:hypothetical protein